MTVRLAVQVSRGNRGIIVQYKPYTVRVFHDRIILMDYRPPRRIDVCSRRHKGARNDSP